MIVEVVSTQMGYEADLTSRIILDVQLDGLDSQDVHHGDGLVRSHLGDGDGRQLVVVFVLIFVFKVYFPHR